MKKACETELKKKVIAKQSQIMFDSETDTNQLAIYHSNRTTSDI